MMLKIRLLKDKEMDEASRVLWKSFYQAEKEETSLEGMTTFRDLTEPLSLKMNAFTGEIFFFGAFRDGCLVAVGALKEKRHILLLFVLPEEQGKGVGTALLMKLLSDGAGEDFTVNAAPGAVTFYRRFGFVPTGEMEIKEGVRFVPMKREAAL